VQDPLSTAVMFVAIVALLDLVVVAGGVQHSLAMFTSVVGTWLPFALIFGVTWATGERRSEEITLTSKSGSEIPVEMVTFSVPAEESELVSHVAAFRDLRERKRLQERLLFAERLTTLGTLAAGIAHEVNNPLSFLLSNLEFLSDHWRAEAETSQVAEVLADTRRSSAASRASVEGWTRSSLSRSTQMQPWSSR